MSTRGPCASPKPPKHAPTPAWYTENPTSTPVQYARQLAHEIQAAPVPQRTVAKCVRLIHLIEKESPAFKARSVVRKEFLAEICDMRQTRSKRSLSRHGLQRDRFRSAAPEGL